MTCRIVSDARNSRPPVSGTLDEQMPMKSHRFIVCRTWNLAEFELMYAPLACQVGESSGHTRWSCYAFPRSFCRMNNMEMERVTEDALAGYGMVVAREQLKARWRGACMCVCVHAKVSWICMPTYVSMYVCMHACMKAYIYIYI